MTKGRDPAVPFQKPQASDRKKPGRKKSSPSRRVSPSNCPKPAPAMVPSTQPTMQRNAHADEDGDIAPALVALSHRCRPVGINEQEQRGIGDPGRQAAHPGLQRRTEQHIAGVHRDHGDHDRDQTDRSRPRNATPALRGAGKYNTLMTRRAEHRNADPPARTPNTMPKATMPGSRPMPSRKPRR